MIQIKDNFGRLKEVKEISVKVGPMMRNVIEGDVYIAGRGWRPFFRKNSERIWTALAAPKRGLWQGVAYNGSRVVIIEGDSNEAYYSDNKGKTWNKSFLPSTAGWQNLTYGNGKFVAVSSASNKAAWSNNGVTWYSSNLPSAGGWGDVSFSNGMFIAVQFGSYVGDRKTDDFAWSTDGVLWTPMKITKPGNWTKVAYNGSVHMVVSAGSRDSAYSSNGKTWYHANMPLVSNWTGLGANGNQLLSVGGTANVNSNIYALYRNGVWSERRFAVPGKWTVVGSNNGEWSILEWMGSRSLLSRDGENWTVAHLPKSGKWIKSANMGSTVIAIAHDSDTFAILEE